jgi:hypothetical protein
MTTSELEKWLAERTDDERGRLQALLPPTAWDMSQERQSMETLLCERFNFFLVFYGLVIAGAAATQSLKTMTLLLWLGGIVSLLLVPPIMRAQQKLDIILDRYLYKAKGHPTCIVNDAANAEAKGWLPKSMRRLIGYYVPVVMALTLLCGAARATFNLLTLAP